MPAAPALTAVVSLLVVLLLMLAESRLSARNERRPRARGAVEPDGDVYATMRWAYPAAFVVMACEGALFGPAPGLTTAIGAVGTVASKVLKYWAVASLGPRWTFRVLVVPEPLVVHGPYAFARHPNYIAVFGELASMALLVGARLTGPVATMLFTLLLIRRIRVEDQILRHFTCSKAGG